MKRWYSEYWAQTWYRNTFLVKRLGQIAKAIGHDHEWNNLKDSGCNFTCLAMIVGIDPARLASVLSSQPFFFADRLLPAKDLTGKTGGLVWDQNAPHGGRKQIVIKNIWHSRLDRRTSITVTFKGISKAQTYNEGKKLVDAMHARGRHIICGPKEHSHLVAGTIGGEFYVWDPDESERPVEENLSGRVTLRQLFDDYPGQPIEFWEYQLGYKP
jgi:hypothetical protein